jgi:hypothetical protein
MNDPAATAEAACLVTNRINSSTVWKKKQPVEGGKLEEFLGRGTEDGGKNLLPRRFKKKPFGRGFSRKYADKT